MAKKAKLSYKELLIENLIHVDDVHRVPSSREIAYQWLKLEKKYGQSLKKSDYLKLVGISRSNLNNHLKQIKELEKGEQ